MFIPFYDNFRSFCTRAFICFSQCLYIVFTKICYSVLTFAHSADILSISGFWYMQTQQSGKSASIRRVPPQSIFSISERSVKHKESRIRCKLDSALCPLQLRWNSRKNALEASHSHVGIFPALVSKSVPLAVNGNFIRNLYPFYTMILF